jgi:hypothetical protein
MYYYVCGLSQTIILLQTRKKNYGINGAVELRLIDYDCRKTVYIQIIILDLR